MAHKSTNAIDMTICTADRMYTEALRSDIPAVVEIASNAMQNAIDACGTLKDGMTADHAETFLTSVKLELDCIGVTESTLRWFATFPLWANVRPSA